MRSFSLLIKPASGDCNLACEYCFYQDKWRLYPAAARHRMSPEVLERMIASYMATRQASYVFGWQGGEPTLMGLDFFRQVTDLQVRHAPRGATIANGLQTNATLIDDAFAAHLAQYQFLLGVSLDGPPEIHDRFRRTHDGRGSHADVWRGIEALRRHAVEFNILVLVSQANVREARTVYRYLRDAGFLFHQYIPCVEVDTEGRLQPYAIDGEAWGGFLCELFDEWRSAGDERRVSIRHFDSLLELLVHGRANVCTLGRDCCQYLVVEYNGDLYPCDFFVDQRLRIGNLQDMAWEAALQSPVYREFGAQKSRWNDACRDCSCLDLCSGDCLKHRLTGPAPDPHRLSWLCAGWKRFLTHARPGFQELAAQVRREQEAERRLGAVALAAAQATRPPSGAAPHRNDPCPCGSGRKYKQCCGK